MSLQRRVEKREPEDPKRRRKKGGAPGSEGKGGAPPRPAHGVLDSLQSQPGESEMASRTRAPAATWAVSSQSSHPQAGQSLQTAAAVPRLSAGGGWGGSVSAQEEAQLLAPLSLLSPTGVLSSPWHGTAEATPIVQFYSRPPGSTFCGFGAGSVHSRTWARMAQR